MIILYVAVILVEYKNCISIFHLIILCINRFFLSEL